MAAAVRGVLTHRDGATQSFNVAATEWSLTAVMGAIKQLSGEVSSALTGLMEAETLRGHTHTHHGDDDEEEDDEDDGDEDEATAPPPEPPPKRSKTNSCN